MLSKCSESSSVRKLIALLNISSVIEEPLVLRESGPLANLLNYFWHFKSTLCRYSSSFKVVLDEADICPDTCDTFLRLEFEEFEII